MDVFLGRKSFNRTDSDGFLSKPMVNPRFCHSKRWMEVIKGDAAKKPETVEPNYLNAEGIKIAESAVVKDLEVKMGFCLPKGNIEKVAEVLKSKMRYKVDCTAFELHEFCEKIQMVLQKVENFGDSEWKVTIAGMEFVFNVENCMSGNGQVTDFECGVKGRTEVRLPVSRIKMCRDYEDRMIEAFQGAEELVSHQEFKRLTERSNFLIQKEVKQMQKLKNELAQTKNDLEWQREELKFYKSEAVHRRDSKLTKESILESEILNLREKRVSIAQGFEDLENEQEKFASQKSALSKILLNLQSFLENFQNNDSRKESPTRLRLEICTLESQLKELEIESRKNFSEENLRLQINRLKTKISSLKSISAISNTLSATSNAKSKMNNFKNAYSVTRLPTRTVTLSNFCSPLASASKINVSRPSFGTVKNDRSLSVSQKFTLQSKLEETKGKLEEGVGQQQGRLVKKHYFTPDSDFKVLKGNTTKIVKDLEYRRFSTEEDMVETVDDFNENKWTNLDDREKLADEKWKFVEKIEELKEILANCLNEIIGH